ncbi:hypothetical protein F1645_16340 (plasmid) [Novacetimonas hansenii]|uniref:hypothetical protein n=1 Tax=Novacetimonas hansenii TaxID=436 RepID=UPI000ADE6DEA|nr:hypothetical protein [Novacetimonas hansenii]
MSNGNGSHPEWENGKAHGNGEDGKPARNSDENPMSCPMADVMFGWPEIAMLADLLRCPLTVLTKSDVLSICGHFRGATDWLLSHGMLRSRLTNALEVNRPLLWRFGSALASSRTKPVSGNAVISELLAGKKQDDLRSVLKVIDQIPTDFAGAILVTPPSPLEPEDMEYLARQFAKQLQAHGLLSVSVCLIPSGVQVSTLSRVAMEQLLASKAQESDDVS